MPPGAAAQGGRRRERLGLARPKALPLSQEGQRRADVAGRLPLLGELDQLGHVGHLREPRLDEREGGELRGEQPEPLLQRDLVEAADAVDPREHLERRGVEVGGRHGPRDREEQARVGAHPLRDPGAVVDSLRRAQEEASGVERDSRDRARPRLGLGAVLVLLEAEVALRPRQDLEDVVLRRLQEHGPQVALGDARAVHESLEERPLLLRAEVGGDVRRDHPSGDEPVEDHPLVEHLGLEEMEAVRGHLDPRPARAGAHAEHAVVARGEDRLQHVAEPQIFEVALHRHRRPRWEDGAGPTSIARGAYRPPTNER